MSRLFVSISLVLCGFLGMKADFANERLNYVVTYKWGVVHKDAGEAQLTLTNSGANYKIVLTGKTKPWADKVFMVRDTLTSVVNKSGLRPVKYVKVAHEGDKYAKDVINYSRSGNITLGKCTRYREKKGKRSTSGNNLSASGPTFDMLSVFYYLRTLDYNNMKPGKTEKCTVFSGSKSETLTIKNIGIETVTLRNKKKIKAYHIKFRFTTEGRKKSSDDIDAWLSADGRHVPVLLQGSLPVGKVKCYLLNY
ncbi:MAG: DUF3108 domain-containing protein [Prevotella sp.]|nr:DUF3108 domain-containing protein [Prevotella sp.]